MTWHWLGVELIFRIDKPSPIGRRVSGVTLKRIMLSGGLLALIGMGLFTPSVALASLLVFSVTQAGSFAGAAVECVEVDWTLEQ